VASERGSRDLYAVHGQAIYRIIRGIVLDAAVADQLTDRTFEAAAPSLRAAAGAGSTRLALHRLAVRAAIRHLRRRGLLRLLRGPVAPVEARSLAAQALGALSAEQRALVMLSLQAGMTHDEIASILGVRPGAVASRLRAARLHMRQALSGAEPDALIVGE